MGWRIWIVSSQEQRLLGRLTQDYASFEIATQELLRQTIEKEQASNHSTQHMLTSILTPIFAAIVAFGIGILAGN